MKTNYKDEEYYDDEQLETQNGCYGAGIEWHDHLPPLTEEELAARDSFDNKNRLKNNKWIDKFIKG